MYLAEWLAWRMDTATAAERAAEKRSNRRHGIRDEPLYESDYASDLQNSRQCVSDAPQLRGPVYVCNDTVLELRCGMFEPWRGLVTIFTIGAWMVIPFGLYFAGSDAWNVANGSMSLWTAFWGMLICGVPSLCLAWVYFKYGFRFTRLEALTSRHLLIRFNRKTRQVHLHRPKYCGGIVTLPWEGGVGENVTANPQKSDEVGRPVMLMWPPEATGLPHQEVAFIGPQSQGGTELRDEWEFIRRFMEDGPAGLPKPELTSHFPWPAQAFKAQLEGVSRFLPNSDSPLMFLGLLLMIPAVLCLGLAHWASLLLCWKPRWPKVIREAGQPGKPVPKLTTIDDYPPDVRERLLANADRWALKPGSRPEKKPRASRKRKAIAETEPEADSE